MNFHRKILKNLVSHLLGGELLHVQRRGVLAHVRLEGGLHAELLRVDLEHVPAPHLVARRLGLGLQLFQRTEVARVVPPGVRPRAGDARKRSKILFGPRKARCVDFITCRQTYSERYDFFDRFF